MELETVRTPHFMNCSAWPLSSCDWSAKNLANPASASTTQTLQTWKPLRATVSRSKYEKRAW
eukprot:767109-Hanusia_phi.AAC.10